MARNSRTFKSIKNAKVALLFYLANLILQFFSRKIFLDYLGAEVLGLNTTVQNLLGFLNLAELGIGSAVAYNLYKPLFDDDTNTINDIVSIQGWLYRKVAYVVTISACILMCFFPLIFVKAQLPLWYVYGSFIVLLVVALLEYFVCYHQIVLVADQKEYKITFVVQGIKILKITSQIFVISYLKNGYFYWMILELFMAIVTAILLNIVLKREYLWLKPIPAKGKELRSRYPMIIKKTKQLFFHRISGFVLTQTSPLIIYAYTSLTIVAIYGNYMLIVIGITGLQNALFNSLNAGVGGLVAEGNKTRLISVFRELFSFRFFMVAVTCFGVYILASPFITLWVGYEYILDSTSLLLIVGILYLNTMRNVVDAYIYAYGLYHDIWAPVIETFLNVGLSISLGYLWGLFGVLLGVLVSLFFVIFLWKPYFLFRRGLQVSISIYVKIYIKHLILASIISILVLFINNSIMVNPESSFLSFVYYSAMILGMYGVFLFTALYFLEQGMRDFMKRMLHYIR